MEFINKQEKRIYRKNLWRFIKKAELEISEIVTHEHGRNFPLELAQDLLEYWGDQAKQKIIPMQEISNVVDCVVYFYNEDIEEFLLEHPNPVTIAKFGSVFNWNQIIDLFGQIPFSKDFNNGQKKRIAQTLAAFEYCKLTGHESYTHAKKFLRTAIHLLRSREKHGPLYEVVVYTPQQKKHGWNQTVYTFESEVQAIGYDLAKEIRYISRFNGVRYVYEIQLLTINALSRLPKPSKQEMLHHAFSIAEPIEDLLMDVHADLLGLKYAAEAITAAIYLFVGTKKTTLQKLCKLLETHTSLSKLNTMPYQHYVFVGVLNGLGDLQEMFGNACGFFGPKINSLLDRAWHHYELLKDVTNKSGAIVLHDHIYWIDSLQPHVRLYMADRANFALKHLLTETKTLVHVLNNWQPQFKAMNLEQIYSQISEQSYKVIDPRAKEFAKECARHFVSAEHFNQAQPAFLWSLDVPDFLPGFETVQKQFFGTYKGYFLKRSDPRAMLLGHYTGCCQHIGNAHGASCAYYGQLAHNSGFFVVEKNGKIVAQSWCWVDAMCRKLVFDTIELANGCSEDDQITIQTVYQMIMLELRPYFENIGYGSTYSDIHIPYEHEFEPYQIDELNIESINTMRMPNSVVLMPVDYQGYTDIEAGPRMILRNVDNYIQCRAESKYSEYFFELDQHLKQVYVNATAPVIKIAEELQQGQTPKQVLKNMYRFNAPISLYQKNLDCKKPCVTPGSCTCYASKDREEIGTYYDMLVQFPTQYLNQWLSTEKQPYMFTRTFAVSPTEQTVPIWIQARQNTVSAETMLEALSRQMAFMK